MTRNIGSGKFGVREYATRQLVWFADENEAAAFEKTQIRLFVAEDMKKRGVVPQQNSFSISLVKRPSFESAAGRK